MHTESVGRRSRLCVRLRSCSQSSELLAPTCKEPWKVSLVLRGGCVELDAIGTEKAACSQVTGQVIDLDNK